MENIITIKNDGNDKIIFDYNDKTVTYSYSNCSKESSFVPVKIPFEEITGIEITKKRFFRAGESCLIIRNRRILNPAIDYMQLEITHFAFSADLHDTCYAAFEKLSKELQVPLTGYQSTICKTVISDERYNLEGFKRIGAEEAFKQQKKREERRCKCNVCGKIFCYNEADIKENNSNMMLGTIASVGTLASVTNGSMYNAYEQNKIANNATNKVVDFNRCPSCNSIDITVLTGEEWEMLQKGDTKSTEHNIVQNSVSSADEILKFKGLLDAGIITQEEFEAKKKQLLGL